MLSTGTCPQGPIGTFFEQTNSAGPFKLYIMVKDTKNVTGGKGEAKGKKGDRGSENATDKIKGNKTLSADRLRQIIPTVTNKTRRREFASRLRTLVKQDRTKRRRTRQAAEARGEKVYGISLMIVNVSGCYCHMRCLPLIQVERGVTHTIETLKRPDATIGKK